MINWLEIGMTEFASNLQFSLVRTDLMFRVTFEEAEGDFLEFEAYLSWPLLHFSKIVRHLSSCASLP